MALYYNGEKVVGNASLHGLTDVDDTNKENGSSLVYNGEVWNAQVITKTLTWEEYQALSDEEKNNGTVYMISDVNGDGQDFQPVIFSEEEREIGIWTDGKPLYQKTIPFNCTSSTITEYVMDSDVDIKGYDTRGSWAVRSNHNIISLNCCISGDSTYSAFISFGNDNGNNNVIDIRHQKKDITNVVVTVIYTKTTDAAGSGAWTPQGVPAVHYSTEEQVVGTWIDGSTIYERTYTFTAPSSNTFTREDLGILMSSISNAWIDVQNSFAKTSSMCSNVAFYDGNSTKPDQFGGYLNFLQTNLAFDYRVGSDLYSSNIVVTIRYTKTS